MPTVAPDRRRTRYHFVVFWFLMLLAAFSGLRQVLLLKFGPASAAHHDLANTFLIGLYRDAYVALLLMLPLLFWFFILPNGWFVAAWHRALFRFACFVWWLVGIFLLMAEVFSLKNSGPVQHRGRGLRFVSHGSFINIWDSYPLLRWWPSARR
jgi:hypothetical protein